MACVQSQPDRKALPWDLVDLEEGPDALTTAPGGVGALTAHTARACAYCGAKWSEGVPKGDDCDEGERALSEATTGCGACNATRRAPPFAAQNF